MSEKYKLEVPVDLSEKTATRLDLAKKIIHLITGVTTLLTICVVAPLIATEAKYEGAGAPGPNYTLFVAIISIGIPFALVYFPWMYEHQNKFRRGGKFFMKTRTNVIFCGFYTFLWGTAGIAITVHSNNAASCALDVDLEEAYGTDYVSAWATQCNLAKVTSGFAWITCILWAISLLIVGINFWSEKSMIQQKLNEHKQNKLEEQRKQHEDEESKYQAGIQDTSPFADPRRSPYQQEQHSPYQHEQHSPYQHEQHSPYQGEKNSPYQHEQHSPYQGEQHSPYQQEQHSPYQQEQHSPYQQQQQFVPYQPHEGSPYPSNSPGQYATPMPQPYHNY